MDTSGFKVSFYASWKSSRTSSKVFMDVYLKPYFGSRSTGITNGYEKKGGRYVLVKQGKAPVSDIRLTGATNTGSSWLANVMVASANPLVSGAPVCCEFKRFRIS